MKVSIEIDDDALPNISAEIRDTYFVSLANLVENIATVEHRNKVLIDALRLIEVWVSAIEKDSANLQPMLDKIKEYVKLGTSLT